MKTGKWTSLRGMVMACLLAGMLFFPVPGRAEPQYRSCMDAPSLASTEGTAAGAEAYIANPPADMEWPYGGGSDVGAIEVQFNAARDQDPSVSVPLRLPSQDAWNAMSDGAKAVWLINRERVDRGVPPLAGVESNVTQVAQDYAEYLLQNNEFSHYADGRDPWQRLDSNEAIGACHDFLGASENIAAFWGDWSLTVERAIFNWMYNDSQSGWGHRSMVLWPYYSDNSGKTGEEGFVGLGRAGGAYMGWPYGEVIVLNVFDPCASWATAASGVAMPGLNLLLEDN